MRKQLRKGQKGFTLIELMIVVAIIGILAAIAIPNFIRFQLKAKTSEAKVNIAAIRTAEVSYFSELGQYVAAGASPPAANIGSAKTAFVDAGGFGVVGWSPEGQVFFSYGVAWPGAGVSESAFTIDAEGDIDGDGASQGWGYVQPVAGTTTGVAGVRAACVATGTADAANNKDELTTVGPCDATFGQSVF